MYDPPDPTDWYYDFWKLAYDQGYNAKVKDECPYKPSGHERDTTLDDLRVYYWEKGFEDQLIERDEIHG